MLVVPLSGLGVLLGIAGGCVALARQGRGVAYGIAGTAIGGLALVFGLLWGPLRVGDVEVLVTAAGVGPVQLKTSNGFRESERKHFWIRATVRNVSATRKVDYRTWALSARVTDNHGNRYRRSDFGLTAGVVGRVFSESIHPGGEVADLLVFEEPSAGVEWLDVELPGEAVGLADDFKFRIPATMLRR
jgi:hypothetical protein